MADAPKILGSDSLRQAFPKLNNAIDNSNEATKKSSTALTTSNSALNSAKAAETKAKSVQDQFNQVVINGDSSVEAAQGRVRDLAGKTKTFTTLKERMDNSDEIMSDIFLNVKAMGAVGDGVTDDTVPIQNALDIAKARGGIFIRIPKGNYKVTKTLVIYNNTQLEMDKETRIIRNHNDSILMNGERGATYLEYAGNSNITIEGGILEGNLNAFPDPCSSIGLAKGVNITVRNVVCKDAFNGHAIDIAGCKDVLIEGCSFLGYRALSGDELTGVREAVQIGEHTQSGFSSFGSFDASPCLNITIRNCLFGASENEAAWPCGVGHHGAVNDVFNRNIKIYDNLFEGLLYAGVRIYKYEDCFVFDNKFNNCQRGVVVSSVAPSHGSANNPDGTPSGKAQAGRNIFIHDNLFKDTSSVGVWVAGQEENGVYARVKNVHITNNTFENKTHMTSHLFYLAWVEDVKVMGNIANNIHRGVYFSYSSNVDVALNKFENISVEGFFSEELSSTLQNTGLTGNARIINNTIKNCGRTGIYVQYMNRFEIKDNDIIYPASEEDDVRHGINVSNNCHFGVVSGNRVKRASSGNQNRYGLNVTSTCSNVQVFNNQLEGKSGSLFLSEVNGNFEGFFSNRNGTQRREAESQTQVGRASVQSQGNDTLSVNVTFEKPYLDTPFIVATVATSAPGSRGVGVSGASATGFTLNIWNGGSTAGPITANWIAKGNM